MLWAEEQRDRDGCQTLEKNKLLLDYTTCPFHCQQFIFRYPVFDEPFNKSEIIGFCPRALVLKVYIWERRQSELVIITFWENKKSI